MSSTHLRILYFFALFYVSEESKILGIFPIAAYSHYSLGNSLIRGLADAGHHVTMMSPFNDTTPTTNGSYRNIVLTGFVEYMKEHKKIAKHFETSPINRFSYFCNLQKSMMSFQEAIFAHPNVQSFANSSETFDVVIVEQLSTEALNYFAYHFKAHLVLFTPILVDIKLNYVVGNPTMLSYTPHIDTDFSREMSLRQRIHNTLLYLFRAALTRWQWTPLQDRMIRKYFPTAPTLADINDNVSLIITNSHVSIQQSIPLVPNIIQIGGYHLKKPKQLPQDLQKYLDNAVEGVVYVSFGSSLEAINLPEKRKNLLLNSLGNLTQKVLWKWEDNNTVEWPSNIKTVKWLPQMDVLAHPNVKLFVTQGGILSLTETIYNETPVLVVPVLGDQPSNAQDVIIDGYGLSISFHDENFTQERFSSMLRELLDNPKYKEKAVKISQLFKDRHSDPMQEAVYWIEYIIRHDGAPNLRVAGIKLPWYQHYLLDVIIIILTTVLISFVIVFKMVAFLLVFLKSRNVKPKIKKN